MDDRNLSSALGDWLHETDVPLPDAADNVRAAVERAGRARQWGWVPRGSGARRRARPRTTHVPLPAALALIIVAVFTTALAFGLLLPDALDVPEPAHTAVSTAEGLHLQTDLIDLRADALRLEMGDSVYTTADAPLQLVEATAEDGLPVLRLDWTENGKDMRLELVVRAGADSSSDAGAEWYVERIRVREQDPESPWASYEGPLFKTPFGQTYENDVELALFGTDEQVVLALDGLRLTAEPKPDPAWWQGAHVLGIPIPDFIGRLLPSDWAPDPQPTPAAQSAPWPRVVVPFAGVELMGALRPDGTVRVDRYTGRNTKGLVDVAVGADDSVWVARPRSVYRIGGSSVVNTKTEGLDGIRWIEPNDDGSLNVHGDGVWRLEGETWTKLSDDVVARPPQAVPESVPATRPDFIYGGMTADGTIWGRTDADNSRLLVLPASDPVLLPSAVGLAGGTGTTVPFVAAGLELQGEDLGQGVMQVAADGTDFDFSGLRGIVAMPDGAMWVADRTEVHRLGQGHAVDAGGPEWIEGISPGSDGRIRVTGDGTWLLEDGHWLDLSASIRGRAMGEVDVIVLNDGTIVGLRYDAQGAAGVSVLEDGAWVRQPADGDLRIIADADHLWMRTDTEGDASDSDWSRLVDGEWVSLTSDAMAAAGSPDTPVQHSFITDDGSLWLILGHGSNKAERVVRYADGRWSEYTLEELEEAAGVPLHLEPLPARDGRSIYIEPATGASGPSMVSFDGESVVTVPRLPPDLFVRGVSDDGSVWAIGNDGQLWVMPQAATIRKLETNPIGGPT